MANIMIIVEGRLGDSDCSNGGDDGGGGDGGGGGVRVWGGERRGM